jgi:hypothetical protein
MRKVLLYGIILLTNTFVSVAQSIENYQGNVSIDKDEKIVQAKFTITFNTFSDSETLKLFIHQSANLSNISSNSKPISYNLLEESFIGEDKAILIEKSEIQDKQLTVEYTYSLT